MAEKSVPFQEKEPAIGPPQKSKDLEMDFRAGVGNRREHLQVCPMNPIGSADGLA